MEYDLGKRQKQGSLTANEIYCTKLRWTAKWHCHKDLSFSLQHIPVSRASWVICIKTENGKRSGHCSSSASTYSPLPSALATSRLPLMRNSSSVRSQAAGPGVGRGPLTLLEPFCLRNIHTLWLSSVASRPCTQLCEQGGFSQHELY